MCQPYQKAEKGRSQTQDNKAPQEQTPRFQGQGREQKGNDQEIHGRNIGDVSTGRRGVSYRRLGISFAYELPVRQSRFYELEA